MVGHLHWDILLELLDLALVGMVQHSLDQFLRWYNSMVECLHKGIRMG